MPYRLQFLSGLIEHVKLLLIDSKVFAEEVEPTGVVPMEVSLERFVAFTASADIHCVLCFRYRLAAIPPHVSHQMVDDDRLKPRVHLTLFHDTQLLSNENTHFQKLLNQWCFISALLLAISHHIVPFLGAIAVTNSGVFSSEHHKMATPPKISTDAVTAFLPL
jgi:hypothetical protein